MMHGTSERPRRLRSETRGLRDAWVVCLLAALPLVACDDSVEGDVLSRTLLDTPALLTGVIVTVQDQGEQALGDLKLRSTGAIVATARVNAAGDGLNLDGCRENCGGLNTDVRLMNIPIIDDSETDLGLDLSALGGQLSLSSVLSDQYTVVSTTPRLVESSDTVFIFDVDAELVRESGDGIRMSFSLTFRWTLALPSMLHDDFREQSPRDDIGLFVTTRYSEPRTRRWRLAEPVHFFVKAVPEAHREAFRAGLEDWNSLGQATLGRDIVSFEFIPPGDPREASMVTGDVRANVIEWDRTNIASYGGIAASRAHPRSGEVFSSSILVQGPHVLELYRDWFGIQPLAGREDRERRLLGLRRQHELPAQAIAVSPMVRFGALELGGRKGCGRMEDRVTYFFEDPPAEVSFDDYMYGYFRAMISHEVGHALGLGHNFMGSLVDDGADTPSSTTMEYVWRGARYRRSLGDYDAAALRFAYGIPPEDQVAATDVPPYCVDAVSRTHPTRNAECSPWDGQVDPFGYFVRRAERAVERAIRAEAVGQAPIWPPNDLRAPLYQGLFGALFYATSAPNYAAHWRRFHTVSGRPTDPTEIQDFVIAALDEVMCGAWVSEHIEASFVRDAEAGRAAARGWATLVGDWRSALQILGLSGEVCVPPERLSFTF